MGKQDTTYRELSDQLEAVLAQLQAEDIDIDTALSLHEQGMKLVSQLEARLKHSEVTIKKLKNPRA